MKTIFFALFLPVLALAEPVHFIHARGRNSPTQAEARSMVGGAQWLWQRDTGEALDIASWRSIRNPVRREYVTVSGAATLLSQVRRWADANGIKGRAMFLSPPLRQGRQWYTAGYAPICSRSIGYAAVTAKNDLGESRMSTGSVAIVHEYGHLRGASHDDSKPVTLMHSDVLPYASTLPRFSEKSLREISDCK